MIRPEHDAEDDECHHRKHHTHGLLRDKHVHALMVVHALLQVAHQFRVEERHRQTQHFHEEIADQGDIDVHAHLQQQPPPPEIHHRTAQRQHQLSRQHQIDELDILVLDTHIDNRLRKERQRQLQETAYQQGHRYEQQLPFI